jgi:hypothetical protein
MHLEVFAFYGITMFEKLGTNANNVVCDIKGLTFILKGV